MYTLPAKLEYFFMLVQREHFQAGGTATVLVFSLNSRVPVSLKTLP